MATKTKQNNLAAPPAVNVGVLVCKVLDSKHHVREAAAEVDNEALHCINASDGLLRERG